MEGEIGQRLIEGIIVGVQRRPDVALAHRASSSPFQSVASSTVDPLNVNVNLVEVLIVNQVLETSTPVTEF
jgi:hypothetical protein